MLVPNSEVQEKEYPARFIFPAEVMSDEIVKRDPDKDFDYDFKSMGIFKCTVNVKIWATRYLAAVLITDLNIGTSVTNAADRIVFEVYHKFLSFYTKESVLFMEKYSEQDGIDLIIPKWDGDKVTGVDWKHIGKLIDIVE